MAWRGFGPIGGRKKNSCGLFFFLLRDQSHFKKTKTLRFAPPMKNPNRKVFFPGKKKSEGKKKSFPKNIFFGQNLSKKHKKIFFGQKK